jgi:adenylate cyclase
LGEKKRAREWMSRALALEPEDINTQYNVACAYTDMGDTDAALDLLERIMPKSGQEMTEWIKYDSDLDPLRNQPRFKKLMELIGAG